MDFLRYWIHLIKVFLQPFSPTEGPTLMILKSLSVINRCHIKINYYDPSEIDKISKLTKCSGIIPRNDCSQVPSKWNMSELWSWQEAHPGLSIPESTSSTFYFFWKLDHVKFYQIFTFFSSWKRFRSIFAKFSSLPPFGWFRFHGRKLARSLLFMSRKTPSFSWSE